MAERMIIDEESLRSILGLANRAPSIHNAQPWHWMIGEDSVHLYAADVRGLAATDPDRRDLLVSCGAVLHHARVAFAARGWTTVVHRLPNPLYHDHLASIQWTPKPPRPHDLALARAIANRRTDRRRFSSWPVPLSVLTSLAGPAARQGAILVPISDPGRRRTLQRAMDEAARRQREYPGYDEELVYWSGRGTAATAGVPAANIPARSADFPSRAFPYGELAESASDDPDAGELVVIGTASDGQLSRLRAGEALSAVLLAATDVGLASCPLTQVLEVGQTRTMVRDEVLGGVELPQVIVRIGWAPISSDPVPPTPRRALDEVLSRF